MCKKDAIQLAALQVLIQLGDFEELPPSYFSSPKFQKKIFEVYQSLKGIGGDQMKLAQIFSKLLLLIHLGESFFEQNEPKSRVQFKEHSKQAKSGACRADLLLKNW